MFIALLLSVVNGATISGKLKDNPYEVAEFLGMQGE